MSAESAPAVLIAHRGASAYAPEHTREAYQLALEQGHDLGSDLPLTFLISGPESDEWLTPEGLAEASEFATGIGPTKSLLLEHPGRG